VIYETSFAIAIVLSSSDTASLNSAIICCTRDTTLNILKNSVFWNVTPCGSCKNRRLEERIASIISWWWRWYVPPKRRFLQDPHVVTSLKTAFFLVTALKTSDLTYSDMLSTGRLLAVGARTNWPVFDTSCLFTAVLPLGLHFVPRFAVRCLKRGSLQLVFGFWRLRVARNATASWRDWVRVSSSFTLERCCDGQRWRCEIVVFYVTWDFFFRISSLVWLQHR
jgi:hypothetical protein